ncbi:MAG: hypothetical protein KFF73_05320 [Cyclobacteriaceae bacterium]|nr:hypothetical protein [Cyclobacteriaceae bacterium]
MDFYKDNNIYAIRNIAGKISIYGTSFSYRYNIKKAIYDPIFRPDKEIYMKMALATRGMGVINLEAKNMKSRLNKK